MVDGRRLDGDGARQGEQSATVTAMLPLRAQRRSYRLACRTALRTMRLMGQGPLPRRGSCSGRLLGSAWSSHRAVWPHWGAGQYSSSRWCSGLPRCGT